MKIKVIKTNVTRLNDMEVTTKKGKIQQARNIWAIC